MRQKLQDLCRKHLFGSAASLTLSVFKIPLIYLQEIASLLHVAPCSQKLILTCERILDLHAPTGMGLAVVMSPAQK